MKKNDIMKSIYIFFVLFFLLIGYFSWFLTFQGKEVVNNPYNKRQDSFSQKVIRGKIYSAEYDVLAETVLDENGVEIRVYPFNDLFAQTVGFNSNGKLGLELQQNYNLLTSNANFFEKLFNEFQNKKNIGNNIITTLDLDMQKQASKSLGNNKGSVVILEPDSGKILAMVSKPDFNPNDIDEIIQPLINGEGESALTNRATQGLYIPGSTFKIFTLLEYIRENPDYEKYSYTCTGSVIMDENQINCNGVHGEVDLRKSFAYSCNSSFIHMGQSLDLAAFNKTMKKFMFNERIPLDYPYSISEFNLNQESGDFLLGQTVMGQGKTRVTPIHMAMVMSAISNNGVLVQPYLVQYTEDYQGNLINNLDPKNHKRLISENESAILKEYLREVVTYGTATELNTENYIAYGKTGTAQFNSTGGENSWFVGCGEKDGKKLVISIVYEDVRSGQKYGVNGAKLIFDAYFNS